MSASQISSKSTFVILSWCTQIMSQAKSITFQLLFVNSEIASANNNIVSEVQIIEVFHCFPFEFIAITTSNMFLIYVGIRLS